MGHQRPTTTDIYLRSVAPNLDRLAGVIEGVVGDVAAHGARLRWWGRFGSVVERAGCFAADHLFCGKGRAYSDILELA